MRVIWRRERKAGDVREHAGQQQVDRSGRRERAAWARPVVRV